MRRSEVQIYVLHTGKVTETDLLFFNFVLEFDFRNPIRVQNTTTTHGMTVANTTNNKDRKKRSAQNRETEYAERVKKAKKKQAERRSRSEVL